LGRVPAAVVDAPAGTSGNQSHEHYLGKLMAVPQGMPVKDCIRHEPRPGAIGSI
jgi:hypothetical protein